MEGMEAIRSIAETEGPKLLVELVGIVALSAWEVAEVRLSWVLAAQAGTEGAVAEQKVLLMVLVVVGLLTRIAPFAQR